MSVEIAPSGLATGMSYISAVLLWPMQFDPGHMSILSRIEMSLAILGPTAPWSGAPSWILAANTVLMVGGIFAVAVAFLRRKPEFSLPSVEDKTSFLAKLVDTSDVAIVGKTINGDVVTWNASAEKLFGYSKSEMIGRKIDHIIPENEHKAETGYRKLIQQGATIPPFESLRRHKNGKSLNVSITLMAIRDPEGKVVGISMIASDNSARLREEKKFRLVVEAMPNGILMIDGSGGIVLANRHIENLFGYERGELQSQNIASLLAPRCRDEIEEKTVAILATPIAGAMQSANEVSGQRKNGSELPIEMSLHPIQTADGMMILAVIVDISERVRAFEALRKFNASLEKQVVRRTAELTRANRDLEEFAYAASHDLKAPLRVIENSSKWLEEDLQPHLTPETRENLNLLRGRVRRMDKLLDDLLEYSRAGSNSSIQKPEVMKGSELIKDILALVGKPLGFEIKVSTSFSDLLVERMPLQQVLMNLISNAIKHHDKKSGQIEINVDDTPLAYSFAVNDDGPGIDPQFHDQIFRMFHTLRPKDQLEGSGMGLALVRRIVEVRGGKIHLASAPGRGSVFAFTWPKLDPRVEQVA